MGRRTETQEQVADLLRTAKESLGLSLAFLTRMDGATQTLEVVESALPLLFRDGVTQPQESTFCQAILDGRLPPVIPDVAALPEAKRLPAARFPRLRSYVSVPVVLSDGSLYGTFCAAGFTSDKGLSRRDQALMEVLAHAAAVVVEPTLRQETHDAAVRERFAPVIEAGGPEIVFQPVVDLASGLRTGAEALSRFPAAWDRPPDLCFADAHGIGEGVRMELLALERAATFLGSVSGYVAMNVSPGTLVDPLCLELLHRLPGDRILLELSEHDPVEDYDALRAALGPLRERGMRLAIDDVGAGFSSLRHIVVTSPDVLKLDRSIVAGLGTDHVLRELVQAMVTFGHGLGARVVAEGVETEQDADMLRTLRVDDAQGWLFGRPGPASLLERAADPSAARATATAG